MNRSMPAAPSQTASPETPTRCKNGARVVLRAASFFSGTAWASRISSAIPAGSVSVRNSTWFFSHKS